MKKKEQLLSFTEPVSFIFAHSALKEGWDNPNVFQICTLNQTLSETKKRQEIGRGLRLCVDQQGERVAADEVNVLTVIANESYHDYVNSLQQEYVDDGEAAPPPPTDARKQVARRNDRIFLGNSEFALFWDKLRQRIHYSIDVDEETLVANCIARLAREKAWPDPRVVIQRGEFVVHKYTLTLRSVHGDRARIDIDVDNTRDETNRIRRDFSRRDDLARILNDQRLRGFVVSELHEGAHPWAVFENDVKLVAGLPYVCESPAGQRISETAVRISNTRYAVFNLVDRAARETGLTRKTANAIFRGLPNSVRRRILSNPEGFAGVFIPNVRNALADHVANRLRFELGDGQESLDLDELFPPTRRYPQKETIAANECGLYDLMQKDSGIEEAFVARLKDDEDVVLYFKFPHAFRVRLPRIIGNYNPDWGIVRRMDGRLTLHLVRETKGSADINKLQFPQEKRKIISASKYFRAAGIDYRPITGTMVDWWAPASEQLIQDGH